MFAPLSSERCGGFAEAPYLCLSGDPYLLVSRPISAMIETRVFLEGKTGSFFPYDSPSSDTKQKNQSYPAITLLEGNTYDWFSA